MNEKTIGDKLEEFDNKILEGLAKGATIAMQELAGKMAMDLITELKPQSKEAAHDQQ